MAKKQPLSRTIQYWRLVDSRDFSIVDEYDWDGLFRKDIDTREQYDIDGIEIAGTLRSTFLPNLKDVARELPSDLAAPFDPELYPIGVVLSTAKDYIPNQEEQQSGNQKPLERDGDNWEPVDNLFVLHLPFGNIIAVMSESVSSSRAGKYAQWLNKALRVRGLTDPNDPDFAWTATPVIDDEAKKKLEESTKLKSFIYAGRIGESVGNEAAGLRSIFNGPKPNVNGLKIEVKVSTDRGTSTDEDSEFIHDWFEETFGTLEGATKAQVSAYVDNKKTPTEIDLISQRLTRKRNVELNDDEARVISVSNAFTAIWEAFLLDRDDLLRLRYNE